MIAGNKTELINYFYKNCLLKIIMKKSLFLYAFTFFLLLFCQTGFSKKVKPIENPTPSLTLKIKGEMGTNGSAVVFNPDKKLYYAVIAGNADYPLEVFDLKGNNLFSNNAGIDTRGLWYNSSSKELQANIYNSDIINGIKLDKKGFPTGETSEEKPGIEAPSGLACACFIESTKEICFLNDGRLNLIKVSNNTSRNMDLNLPCSVDDINGTTVCYTGIKGMEIALLNYNRKEIYLFDLKTGLLGKTITLPSDAITNDMFRFSYANKFIWLYDTEIRQWTGYQIFK
jgi:hypothetical protein